MESILFYINCGGAFIIESILFYNINCGGAFIIESILFYV